GGEITTEMLSAADIETSGMSRVPEAAPREERRPAILPMWQQEQRITEDAIASFGGNVSLAAAALEISPSTIYRKRQGWAELASAS
ncbi:MAG TPA: helix-turn-helix domain-containing protein, partial [Devosia sp.]|nr:helix-turn-helix domain-containing protein [Devosia sp.]